MFFKNPTSYASNSSNFEENENYDLYGTIKFDEVLQKKWMTPFIF